MKGSGSRARPSQMPMEYILTVWLPVAVCLSVCYFILARPSTGLPTPPGPRGKLLSGNTHQIPRQESWKTYATWGREYGPVVQFRVFTRRFVVLNTAEAVSDLLDRRAAIYSDRPKAWMFHALCGRAMAVFNISSQHPRHRRYRRMLQAGLGARATQAYWPLLQDEARVLLRGLRTAPRAFERHIRRNAAAVIMKVAFGYSITTDDDDFVAAAEETSKITGWAMAPGRWLVDSFPILRFVPAWMPGAGFKHQAKKWADRLDFLSTIPHRWVKAQIASGDFVESFSSALLCPADGSRPDAEEEDIIKWCAGGLYAGAADTTVSALLSFVMLMALHPAVQQRGQQEVDAVTGGGKLAEYDQLEQMPYLSAVLKEVLRFAPVAPLSLPHKVIRDDEHNGLRIRKDTAVIPNVWAIMHDAQLYPDPFVFDPERFMPPDSPKSEAQTQPDPRKFAFGFGARTCPGMHFAEKSMLLSMCAILAHFTILKAPEVDIEISTLEYTTGITSHIRPFKCIFRTRTHA